ncbi:rhamnan synthesis F family protein [Luteimonas sp. SDU101]|uniref:rhamnan synthesis F family protein n=1 Tax=Luteimonas sp. SDU101 TaxID=3422593 RepID=UPI003EB8E482
MADKNTCRLIAASGLFDSSFYESQYPDVLAVGVNSIEHYVRWGSRMGRRPSSWFDTDFYLRRYPDVAKAGLNPFFHYVRYGQVEGRLPNGEGQPAPEPLHSTYGAVAAVDMHGVSVQLWPTPVYSAGGFAATESPESPCVLLRHAAADRRTSAVFSIGVHAHVHYVDQIGEVLEHLENLPPDFSLYVSVHTDDARLAVEECVRKRLPDCHADVRVVPNIGRDIAPMVVEFGPYLLRHDLMLHIHTKRSPHNGAKADWRRQLLWGLLGTKGVVRGVLDLFANNRHVGMLFPEYHHSLRGQISWGTNFPVCTALAGRLAVPVVPERLTLFPAGSMFWARTASLQKLMGAGLTYSDFPAETGQVDGTLAHAVERLLGTIVRASGADVLQSRVDRPYLLAHYYPKKWPFPAEEAERAASSVARFKAFRPIVERDKRVVVYTAISGGYESLLPQVWLNPAYDYVAFCDRPVMDGGCWDVRPMDYWSPDPVRMARYVKTHPHKYFRGYDYAVWVDANVMMRADISKYVEMLADRPDIPVGGIPHPIRRTIASEAEAVIAAKKDDPAVIEKQMERYKVAGFPDKDGLIETNFMVVALEHPQAAKVMSRWWSEIDCGSRRDQLSLNYALWQHRQDWIRLFDEHRSLRDTKEFAYFGHGRNSGYPFDLSTHPLGGRLVDPYAPASKPPVDDEMCRGKGAVDIVICVHDALDDVRLCLSSVVANMRPNDSIVVVDDASGADTAMYLDSLESQYSNLRVLRNPAPARGYSVSANIGMRACSAEFVLLLNSDAILPPEAIDRMVSVMEENPTCGVVGPLSNAASTQSIPYITGTAEQTAINQIPAGLTLEQVDAACRAWSGAGLPPSVPLVHGFCQLIRRSLIIQAEGFDEESFPEGYGEENDFCLRATDLGFDLKVATNVYVFHRKSASYSDDERRSRLMRAGSEQLRRKHGADRVSRAIKTMQGHPLLERVRSLAAGLV